MDAPPEPPTSFADLQLDDRICRAVAKLGYEAPSPIQASTIPPLLAGRDVLGQAQTGTGKTAAFALPTLSLLDLGTRAVQALVLTPTRELAIQVAEAFHSYAGEMRGFHVLPVYGGQPYPIQIQKLQKGVHVVVGTPGRVMDHMRRGTLSLDELAILVLDEADEMLKMGFQEDVAWILEQTPRTRQIALFSATMPPEIQRIARKHMRDPEEILLEVRATAATTVRQRYQIVPWRRKLEALTRLLEIEPFDGMLVFVRTKNAAAELAEKLEARGHNAAALSGDVPQKARERIVQQLKNGKLDIIVGTDVAARGLDVDRISHVINYDLAHDSESYVHRIGRTGRAGRSGEAIVFLTPRERHMLPLIERATSSTLEKLVLPTTGEVNAKRIAAFKDRVRETMAGGVESVFAELAQELLAEPDTDPALLCGALAQLVQGQQPFLLEDQEPEPEPRPQRRREEGPHEERPPQKKGLRLSAATEPGKERFRIEVGEIHGVRPGNIVGAILGESSLQREDLGSIEIHRRFSTVDLPSSISSDDLRSIGRTRVFQQKLKIRRVIDGELAHGLAKRKHRKGKRKPAGEAESPTGEG